MSITTTDKRKLFRPSAAPGKEHCGHFEPTISTSPNAARGNGIHGEISVQLPELFKQKDWPQQSVVETVQPYIKYALRILLESGLHDIGGVERLVQLHDREGAFVTEGTVDFFGLNENLELLVYDWKSGQERNYSAQVILYTLGLMQEEGYKRAWVHEVFVDQERTYRTLVDRTTAEERIFKIVDQVRDPRAPHVINGYCDYCDLRHDCPAWMFERKKLDEFLPVLDAEAGYKFESRLAVIQQNPLLLTNFIRTWKLVKKFVEKSGIETDALARMKNGEKLEGLKLALSSHGTNYIMLE
jgi:hypothetical protein